MLSSGVSMTTLYSAAIYCFSTCNAHVNAQPNLYSYELDKKDFVKIISVHLADTLKVVIIRLQHN